MFETNTQNNSELISLSRAAQLTGYHQDYLGQLCRLGKLTAIKVGRNWFTSSGALDKLSAATAPEINSLEANTMEESTLVSEQAAVESTAFEMSENADEGFEYTEPKIIQNITVSQVDGMPISIRTLPTLVRNANVLQNILTNIRIESLQREVLELRQLIARVMEEVGAHSKILQGRIANLQGTEDKLKHQYISNFNFDMPHSRINTVTQNEDLEFQSQSQSIKQIGSQFLYNEPTTGNNLIVVWAAALAVVAIVVIMGAGIYTGQFFGNFEVQVSTVYYHHPISAPVITQLPAGPTVAGDTLPTVPVDDIH